MFRNLFSGKGPLSEAPAVRRMKTYSAQTGYVYSYYYEGRRRASRPATGSEFVFSVSADRKKWRRVGVSLADADLIAWNEAHDREFSSTELYALAKMALFQAFDERPEPASVKGALRVRLADIEAIAETLGL